MRIDFDMMDKVTIPNFKGGAGNVDAQMYFDGKCRIMIAAIRPDSSIGMHTHDSSSEVMIFVSGCGKAVCDGNEEDVSAGMCHYCPKGSSHSVINTGPEDLIMYCVVAEQ